MDNIMRESEYFNPEAEFLMHVGSMETLRSSSWLENDG